MKVTLVGGKPQSLEVEEQEDGSYLGEDGTRYELEHVSGVYKFVRKAESIIDAVEETVEKVEEEVGAPESVIEATDKVEGYISLAEDAAAPGLPVEPSEGDPVDDDPEQTEGEAA